ncbi:hypothetical protein LXL04_031542 [Taraxacum kok-saghyz]
MVQLEIEIFCVEDIQELVESYLDKLENNKYGDMVHSNRKLKKGHFPPLAIGAVIPPSPAACPTFIAGVFLVVASSSGLYSGQVLKLKNHFNKCFWIEVGIDRRYWQKNLPK